MEFYQIEAFIELAKQLNFSKSAKTLNITQSTMSTRIHKLEQQLGVALFYRSGRKIGLTSFGEMLLPYAQKSVEALEEGLKKLSQEKIDSRNRLRLGVSNPFAMAVLPNVLPLIYLKILDLNIQVTRTLHSEEIMQLVEEHKLDIGIVNNIELYDRPEGKFADASIAFISLYRSPLLFVTNRSHPLCKEKFVTPDMLNREKLVRLGSNTITTRLLEKYFKEQQISPVFEMEINHIEATLKVIKTQPCCIILPRIYVHEEMLNGSLVGIPLSPPPPELEIYLSYSPGHHSEDLIQTMIGIVHAITNEINRQANQPCTT